MFLFRRLAYFTKKALRNFVMPMFNILGNYKILYS